MFHKNASIFENVCEKQGSCSHIEAHLTFLLSKNVWKNITVVKIFAFSHEMFSSSKGQFVLILEHGGDSLANMIKKNPIDPRKIIKIIKEVLNGLDYIHKFGGQKLIHLDLKTVLSQAPTLSYVEHVPRVPTRNFLGTRRR